MNEWNIQSRAHHCQSCGRPFADKDACHTVLLDERREYQRLDLCAVCWKEQFSQGVQDRKGFISCWQSVYESPPPAPPDPIQRETAESLLRKIIERNDPNYAPAAFILAVMLERKRILKVKEQLCHEGRRIFIYEQAKTGDLFTIPDPALQLNQLDAVQRVVADLLEHGLPSPQTEMAFDHAPSDRETVVGNRSSASAVSSGGGTNDCVSPPREGATTEGLKVKDGSPSGELRAPPTSTSVTDS